MFLSTIASVIGIAAGAKNLLGGSSGGRAQQGGQQAAAAADPFGPFRNQYAQQLGVQYNNLNNFDPSKITSNPEYQFQLDQGLGSIDKGAAASGMLGSGTRLMDLQKYGQGLASSFANTDWQRKASILQMLGGFSGATNGNMGAAGNAITQGNQFGAGQANYGLNSITSGLNGLGGAYNNYLWNSGNPSGSSPGLPDPSMPPVH